MTRILVIGSGMDDKFIGNCLRACKKISPDMHFDFIASYGEGNSPFRKEVDEYVSVKKYYSSVCYKIPKLRGLCNQYDLVKTIREYADRCKGQGMKYAACQIHALNPFYAKVADDLKYIADRLIISPWGSDILRAKPHAIPNLRKLAAKSDVITCPKGIRFENNIIDILHAPAEKLYDLSLGVIAIDEILKREAVTIEQAKHSLGVEGKYTIVIGYNANPGHNHLKAIESLASVRGQLPAHYIVLVPLTYGGSPPYKAKIELLLKSYDMPYKLFLQYMSDAEVVNLRKATDLFIHAQQTDANCGTIAEYLLCRKKIINPSWITYPHYEVFGSPFYSFSNFNELPQAIVTAVRDTTSRVSTRLADDIALSGWNHKAADWVKLYKK